MEDIDILEKKQKDSHIITIAIMLGLLLLGGIFLNNYLQEKKTENFNICKQTFFKLSSENYLEQNNILYKEQIEKLKERCAGGNI